MLIIPRPVQEIYRGPQFSVGYASVFATASMAVRAVRSIDFTLDSILQASKMSNILSMFKLREGENPEKSS